MTQPSGRCGASSTTRPGAGGAGRGRRAPNALDLARVAVGDRDLRPVLHRLDYETSGVLVFARTTAAASALCAPFRKSTDGAADKTRKTPRA